MRSNEGCDDLQSGKRLTRKSFNCGWNYRLYTPLADQLSETDLVDLLVMWLGSSGSGI